MSSTTVDTVTETVKESTPESSAEPTSKPETPKTQTVQRVVVEHWAPVSIWNFDTQETECLICKNQLTEKCADCMVDTLNQHSAKCSIAKGKCGHAFHHHCISKSRNVADTCPVDNTPWHLATSNMNSASQWNKISQN